MTNVERSLIVICNNKDKEIEELKSQLNNSTNFHCPNFTCNDRGYVTCDLDKHNMVIEIEELKSQLTRAIEVIKVFALAEDHGLKIFGEKIAKQFLAEIKEKE